MPADYGEAASEGFSVFGGFVSKGFELFLGFLPKVSETVLKISENLIGSSHPDLISGFTVFLLMTLGVLLYVVVSALAKGVMKWVFVIAVVCMVVALIYLVMGRGDGILDAATTTTTTLGA